MLATLFPVVFALIFASNEHKSTTKETLGITLHDGGKLAACLSEVALCHSIKGSGKINNPGGLPESEIPISEEKLTTALVTNDEIVNTKHLEAIELGTQVGAAFLAQGKLGVADLNPSQESPTESTSNTSEGTDETPSILSNLSWPIKIELPSLPTLPLASTAALKVVKSLGVGLLDAAKEIVKCVICLYGYISKLKANAIDIAGREDTRALFRKLVPWLLGASSFYGLWLFYPSLMYSLTILQLKVAESCSQGSLVCCKTIQTIRSSTASFLNLPIYFVRRSMLTLIPRDEVPPVDDLEEKETFEPTDPAVENRESIIIVSAESSSHDVDLLSLSSDLESAEYEQEVLDALRGDDSDREIELSNYGMHGTESDISDNLTVTPTPNIETSDRGSDVEVNNSPQGPELHLRDLDDTLMNDDPEYTISDDDQLFATSTPRPSLAPPNSDMDLNEFHGTSHYPLGDENESITPQKLQQFLHEQYNRLRTLGISFESSSLDYLNLTGPGPTPEYIGSMQGYVEDTRSRIKRRLLNMSSIV